MAKIRNQLHGEWRPKFTHPFQRWIDGIHVYKHQMVLLYYFDRFGWRWDMWHEWPKFWHWPTCKYPGTNTKFQPELGHSLVLQLKFQIFELFLDLFVMATSAVTSDVRAWAWPESPGLGIKAWAQAHQDCEPGPKPLGGPGLDGLGPKPGLCVQNVDIKK